MPTTYFRNLIPGQWQIGDIVMGRGTNILVESIVANPWDIENQDTRRARSDEINFGKDSWKPTTIEFTFEVMHNYLLPEFAGSKPNFWHSMPSIVDLKREWRANEVRKVYGQLKPIYMCSKYDEKVKVILGRTGQFAEFQDDMFDKGEVVKVTAEFRRADTYSYSLEQNAIALNQANPDVSINGTNGEAPSWIKMLLKGPLNHPIITLTNLLDADEPIVIDFDYNIPSGKIIEINGEPWARRVVSNDNPPLSLPAKLIGDTPYLDRLVFDFNRQVDIELTAGGMTSESEVLMVWRDTYEVL
jgi:hypothetical protein